MTNLHQALQTFWGGFGLSAYEVGRVPHDAPLPYLTYEAVQGAPFRATVTPVVVWVKETSGTNAAQTRAQYMDTIAAELRTGARLDFTGGCVVLYPNTADYLTYLVDPTDSTILGGRISVEMHFYCE